MPSKITNRSAHSVAIYGLGRIDPGASVIIPEESPYFNNEIVTLVASGVLRITEISSTQGLIPEDQYSDDPITYSLAEDLAGLPMSDPTIYIPNSGLQGEIHTPVVAGVPIQPNLEPELIGFTSVPAPESPVPARHEWKQGAWREPSEPKQDPDPEIDPRWDLK
jgi:hypothetical protein